MTPNYYWNLNIRESKDFKIDSITLNSYVFSEQVSNQLLGLFLILNETSKINTEKFDMFSVKSKMLKPVLGEIIPNSNFWSDIYDEIKLIPQYSRGPALTLIRNAKLREVNKESVVIEMVIKDCDLEHYNYSHYEQTMEELISDENVFKIHQAILYKYICIKYAFENIKFIFDGKVKRTFLKVAESAISQTIEIGETIVERGAEYKEKTLSDWEKQLSEQERKLKKANGSIPQDQMKKIEREIVQKREVIKKYRRTDEELKDDTTDSEKRPEDFQYETHVPLSVAIKTAPGEPGVYILYHNGEIMKCGRAAYSRGIHWRFTQYYNLNYDNRARNGDYWAVSPENRDNIIVSWQCCPVSKCKELEYKLFKKYQKGPWGLRAPAICNDDTWDLLI